MPLFAAATGILAGVLAVGVILPAAVPAADTPPQRQPRNALAVSPTELGSARPLPGQTRIDATTTAGSGAIRNQPAAEATAQRPSTRRGTPSGQGDVPTAASSTVRRASDVGVTEDEVRLGFFLLDVTGGDRVGFAVGISVEQQQTAVRAFVANINDAGGIHGRRLRPHFAAVNLLDNDAGRAACLALTEDADVFAATGRMHRADAECVATEKQRFFLNNVESAPDGMFRASAGLLTNTYARAGRLMPNWVAELQRLSYIDNRPIGIVTDEKEDPRAESARQLQAELERHGHRVVRIARLSGDLQTASSQIPVEVNQMRTAGAELVFLMANPLPDTQFVQQAEAQGWRPRYAASDWAAHAGDTSNSNMPRSFEGTLALTAAPVGRGTKPQPGWAEPVPAQDCRRIYERESGTRLAARGTNEYSLTMVYCDSVRILASVLQAAGPNPTRTTMRDAVTKVGEIGPLAARTGGSFGPGKPDLDDFLRFQAWNFECKCFKPIEQFRRAKH